MRQTLVGSGIYAVAASGNVGWSTSEGAPAKTESPSEPLMQLIEAARTTAPFHNVDNAIAAGWSVEPMCLDYPDGYRGEAPGAMGHYFFSAEDTLNLYDVSGLAHYELHRAIGQGGNPPGLEVTQAELLADMAKALDGAIAQGSDRPVRLPLGHLGHDLPRRRPVDHGQRVQRAVGHQDLRGLQR